MGRFITAVVILFASAASVSFAQTAIESAEGTWVSPSTGREFNNPMSAVIDGQLLQMQQNQRLFNQMMMAMTFDAQWREIGTRVIDSGNANTALAPLDAAMAARVANLTLGDDASIDDRAAMIAQLSEDLRITRQIAKDRHVDASDAANLFAMAMLIGYERYTGATATPQQQAGVAGKFREMLLKDAIYQGQGRIAAERQAAKFAAAIAQVKRVADAGDAAAAKQAGGALLASLWHDPIDAIEPTADGFIDRGRRIVNEGSGTTRFKPVDADQALADEAVKGVYFGSVFAASEEESKRMVAEQQAAWTAQHVADVESIRAHAKKLGLDANDLAACGVAAVDLLWPLVDSNSMSLDDAQRRSLYAMFENDIKTDPAFQRMDDAGRQRVFDRWAARAADALRDLAAAARAKEIDLQAEQSQDAMERLTLASQAGVFRAQANVGRSHAIGLLKDLFSPRPLAKIELEADGFVVKE